MFRSPRDPYYVDLNVHKFKAEYAKSGRMKCKGCGEEIDKDTVRIAVIERITCDLFSANDYKWHHEHCFFKKVSVVITPEHIRDLSTLKEEDQERIKSIIETIATILSRKRRIKRDGKPVKKVKVETNKE
ncbi:poly [ADP-ribose] polymerase 1-like [Spodoptera litura]|uniref:Poly [ADP-ribose] polymerase 1-like n=1 Tax=Spodoptera litura TaxID=69820 RepID=A0A9J7DU61_SPOLT|nr:poly [ADP-ribose] polymerase 1-like [Spodoptera litura]